MGSRDKLRNRTLFFGDNLKVLEEKIPDESFDLIYLDPPFNSNRDYNVLFKEGRVDSTAQIHAFEDTWEWTEDTVQLFDQLRESRDPKIAILVSSLAEFVGKNSMMAYLVNMVARLIPLRRALKSTGSIYLHCDPTASHYLKIILDVIFGKANFKNEIVWFYSVGGKSKKWFARKHDIVFFYTKGDKWTFNGSAVGVPRKTGTESFGGKLGIDEQGRRYQDKRTKEGRVYRYYLDEGKIPEDVWEIQSIQSQSAERLGYPTQKPEALLERIIKASSNEGDWILDPFCGCGTTVAVAERLQRNWVGIDISMQAINVIKGRMRAHYKGIPINIDGIPSDFESAAALAERDKFAFQDWAISLIGASPPSGETRKGADRGIDGLILFYDRQDLRNPKLKKILVQVKGGGTGRGDIARLKGDIEREGAPMGVLISLNDPTSEMRREAILSGEYQYLPDVKFPRVQALSVKEWFEGRTVRLPTDVVNPFKRALPKSEQKSLFDGVAQPIKLLSTQ